MNENDAMNLEDLKQAWAQLDQRVDSNIAKMEAITGALAEDHTRTLVRRAVWLPAMELTVEATPAKATSSGVDSRPQVRGWLSERWLRRRGRSFLQRGIRH